MNTVIPLSGDDIASHFTKAERFLFIDPQGQVTNTHANPALSTDNCSGKKSIFELFKAENVGRVIVRNIGQRSLGKLLDINMNVFQTSIHHVEHNILLDSSSTKLLKFTKAEQGRPSLKHEAKADGCGCGDKSSSTSEKSCCGHSDKGHSAQDNCAEEHQGSAKKGKCCQGDNKGHGKGKCH